MTEHSTDERPEHDPQDEAVEPPVTESETGTEEVTEDVTDDASTIVDPDASEDAVAATEGEEPESTMSRVERLENEGEIAADYLEELLDIADLDGDLDMDVEGDRAAVSIVGAELTQLVGVKGEVLDALQELTRLAVYRETGERSRLMLDISGHRAQRRETLVAVAEQSDRRGQGVRGAGRARADDVVRAQGRARRGHRGRPRLGVRGRRAAPLRGDPPGVAPTFVVSRETSPPAPEVARGVFSPARLPLAEAYAGWLADAGTVRGLIGPREVPRLWERHLLNCAVLAEAIPEGSVVCDLGLGRRAAGSGAGHRPSGPQGHPGRAAAAPHHVPRRGGDRPRARVRSRCCAAARRTCTASAPSTSSPRARSRPWSDCWRWSMPLVAPDGALVAMKGSSIGAEIEVARPVLERFRCARAAGARARRRPASPHRPRSSGWPGPIPGG